ncbi:MAG: fumarate hydratase [Deltaproteobacteria bacterium]|nr:fumarate hydratase [Deltaproteobacteria bacterium]
MIRELQVKKITQAVKRLCIEANENLGEDVLNCFQQALQKEISPVGKEILEQLIENARISREEHLPMCQDTGLAVIFLEIGQDLHLTGGDLKEAVNQGVREGYGEGYLRKSSCHPFTRANTGDNTPAVIYINVVPGERLKIWVVPKGGGSENMSRLFMLPPSAGLPGIKEKIVETVKEAGPNPCPPTIIGVGIGGTFEQAALQAKKSLLRPLGSPNPDPELDRLEIELLEMINKLGIGPQGLGGRTTSLAVHIRLLPCHIASLPVAVNIQCHASRHKEITL